MEKAMFGAGCFWGVEVTFRELRGVKNVTSGYSGGKVANPSYEQVCSDKTGHAEVVLVEYDPAEVGYEALLDVFWECHDPTSRNRQGPDVGSQYRSVIFYFNGEQKMAALSSKEKLEHAGIYNRPIVTEVEAAGPFYPAEEYHQRYLEKHGLAHCHI